jgi:hypothetical protein
LERYRTVSGGDKLPVSVESIVEDLLGLAVEERQSSARTQRIDR